MDTKLGRQVLNWGASQLVTGGINSAINPSDFASQFRPGALPADSRLPVGMVSAKLATGTNWDVEGFLPYEFRSAVLPGCGTFFDSASVCPQGCNMAAIVTPPLVPLANATAQKQLISGLALHRTDAVKARSSMSPTPMGCGCGASPPNGLLKLLAQAVSASAATAMDSAVRARRRPRVSIPSFCSDDPGKDLSPHDGFVSVLSLNDYFVLQKLRQ